MPDRPTPPAFFPTEMMSLKIRHVPVRIAGVQPRVLTGCAGRIRAAA
jgi:hypothetical protein